jgi:hypothetical protein
VENAANKTADALAEVAASGGIIGPELRQSIREFNRDAPGAGPGRLFEFFQQQTQLAAEGIKTFVNTTKVTTQAGATAMGASFAAVFADMQLQGMTTSQIFAALGPSMQTFGAQLEAAGLSGGAAFNALNAQAAILTDAVTGPLVQGAEALNNIMVGLGNTGAINQEIFAGLSSEVTATFKKIEGSGVGSVRAVQALQKPLQTVWELWHDQGLEIDDATREVLEFAESQGMIGDKFRSESDKMTKAIGTLIERISGLIDVLTNKLPAGAAVGAQGVTDELAEIKVPTIRVPVEFDYEDFSPPTNGAALSVSGAAVIENDISIQVDGAEIARASARNTGRVLAPYGV